MKRLFIAIPIQDESKTKIVSGILSDEKIKHMPVRWSSYQNLHLTIQFLGDVDEKRIGDLKQILNRIRIPAEKEYLKFTEIGAFPGIKNPKIIYLGLFQSEFLMSIHRQIKNDIIRNGFSVDGKPFRPHLTLGRVREGSAAGPAEIAYIEEIFKKTSIDDSQIDRIILFESRLHPAGPVYSSLYEKKLV